jgi:nucleotide-binding universal stress UspA family protein
MTNKETHSDLVVVGLDGSADSTTALHWAERYAKSTHARLRLVTAWNWLPAYGGAMIYEGYRPNEEAQEVLDKALAELTLPPDRVESVCRQGAARSVLVEESKDAALLVVGSHGHTVLGSVLLGSVSNHCVHHAACPVVVAR